MRAGFVENSAVRLRKSGTGAVSSRSRWNGFHMLRGRLEAAHARQDAGGLHSKIIVMENSCAHIAVRKGTAHAKSARRVEGCALEVKIRCGRIAAV